MALVQATTGFHTSYGGEELSVMQGDIFDAGHEIVRRTPTEWWSPIYVRYAAAPEEATTKKKRVTKAAAEDAALD